MAITTLAWCAASTWCAAGAGTLDLNGDPAAKKPSRDPELMVTTDAGSTWTTHPVPIPVNVQQLPAYNNLPAETTYWPGQVDAVSCSSPGVCNVVGHVERNSDVSGPASDALVFLHTDDGGSTWSSTVLPERLMSFHSRWSCSQGLRCQWPVPPRMTAWCSEHCSTLLLLG